MSELSFSNANKPHFSISLLLSDLMLLFSSIISHPLYFLYFVFFSPYIFKLLSFLSPSSSPPSSSSLLSSLSLRPFSSPPNPLTPNWGFSLRNAGLFWTSYGQLWTVNVKIFDALRSLKRTRLCSRQLPLR